MTRFAPEPPRSHAQVPQTGVLFCNLGTPDAPTAPALRSYLRQFLSDRRVVEIPRWLWMLILHGIILRVRPARSAAKYASIWTQEGSPLRVWTQQQAQALQESLTAVGHPVQVRYAMRYGQPSIEQELSAMKAEGVERILILPAYPQYSCSTTASVLDAVSEWVKTQRNVPELRFVKHYHDHTGYIDALAHTVRAHWQAKGRASVLIMSFHGTPQRYHEQGDPYFCECQKTARLLAQALGLQAHEYRVTFQSRFGKAAWLQPYTAPTLHQLVPEGALSVDVMCPGFTSDCLETLEEINQEARMEYIQAGGQAFHYIPCLNADTPWIEALRDITLQHLQGWPTEQEAQTQLAAHTQERVQRAQALGAQG